MVCGGGFGFPLTPAAVLVLITRNISALCIACPVCKYPVYSLLLNFQYIEYTTLCITSYDIPNLMNESEIISAITFNI